MVLFVTLVAANGERIIQNGFDPVHAQVPAHHSPVPIPTPVYKPAPVQNPAPALKPAPVDNLQSNLYQYKPSPSRYLQFNPLPVHKPAPVHKQVPVHKTSPVYNPVPVQKTAPVHKAAPVHKPTPVYHPVPAHKQAPVYKPVLVQEPSPVYKPAPVHKPTPVYHPVPIHRPAPVYKTVSTYKQPEYNTPPKYHYEYAVKDEYSGVNFGLNESRDGYSTFGVYRVYLPDCRTQIVKYKTDDEYSGNIMEVTYEGTPCYETYKPIHKKAQIYKAAKPSYYK